MAAVAAATASLPRAKRSSPRCARNGLSFSAPCGSSPRCPMPEWRKLVSEHLGALALDPPERAEVVEEIAAHLDETFADLRHRSLAEQDATTRSLRAIPDSRTLRPKNHTTRGQ